MKLTRRIGSIAGMLILIAAGLSVGAIAFEFVRPAPAAMSVVLEPRSLEFVEAAFRNDHLKAQLTLRNDSTKPIHVVRASTSCLCTELTTRNKAPLTEPLTIPPGESIPLQASIDTSGGPGKRSVSISVFCSIDNQLTELSSSIQYVVALPLLIEPTAIVLNDVEPLSQHERTIEIYDSYPDRPCEIDQVTSSDPDRIKVSLDSGSNAIELRQHREIGAANMRHRYVLKVAYQAPVRDRDVVQDQIQLILNDDAKTQISMPVVCNFKRPAYEVHPSSLAVSLKSTLPVQRSLRYISRENPIPVLRLKSAPDFVKVEAPVVGKAGATIRLTIDRPPSETEPREHQIVFQQGNGDLPDIVVPLLLMPG